MSQPEHGVDSSQLLKEAVKIWVKCQVEISENLFGCHNSKNGYVKYSKFDMFFYISINHKKVPIFLNFRSYHIR